MPAHPSNSESHSHDVTPADQPLSRRERRGKAAKQQPIGGRVQNAGRAAVPASKHMNYRRG
ncbi:hypothetical protein [Nocardia sp. NPDC056000]|uniref:hypothetical protein n=1 Tax=Nocardia sp. NPDC056000 TaxID=3345674 RepID=UPI0035E000FF